jgi:hypothetical protein
MDKLSSRCRRCIFEKTSQEASQAKPLKDLEAFWGTTRFQEIEWLPTEESKQTIADAIELQQQVQKDTEKLEKLKNDLQNIHQKADKKEPFSF